MDFKQVEAFVSVAKHKSFSKAADHIFISQPTISSHISALEKELKVQLFDRTSKVVHLTPAGESLLEYAMDMISLRNNAITNVSNFHNNIRGTLTLSASTTPFNSIVPKLLHNFHDKYPDVKFSLKEQGSGNIIKDIINLNCEIGIVGTNFKNDKILSHKLIDDELVVVHNGDFNIPEQVKVQDIINHDFLMREKNSATRRTFESALINSELKSNKLNIICEIDNINALLQLVKEGLGITIVSKQLIINSFNNYGLKVSNIVDLDLKRCLYLVINRNRTLTPVAKSFISMCVDQFDLKL
ncbi:selenium metabolism-associated LysR family transcriptional regulator [Oceanirhabdus sp. W0125-5]|uniref:selenium metabolism-associated LysR family transcriptional regulator n=1 Tax=Oceanirhabdus sp. W0125-5 TaxID=2999116 RepID=UPI0022F30D0F|nr:selenium metabolism-associated LysR family transcriptional regulator [Oceanirhabdus sp. W0125-5]WBW97700.1 selenium metabolism-associated LysR family transcriptional regulator [Oceanirhabdus sp. W0125-5]